MASLRFAAKRPMADGEKAYQLKGHAKYVDIARLFGWKALGDYWKLLNEDEEKGLAKASKAMGMTSLICGCPRRRART